MNKMYESIICITDCLTLPIGILFVAVICLVAAIYKQNKQYQKDKFVFQNVTYSVPTQTWRTIRPMGKTVLIFSYGTRGDIQPVIALALSLKEKNIDVVVSCPDCYEEFVNGFDITFKSIGVPKVLQPVKLFSTENTCFSNVLDVLDTLYSDLGNGMWNATKDLDISLIIATAFTRSLAFHISETLDVPCWTAHLAPPDIPTCSYPPTDCEYSKFGWWNKMRYHIRSIKIVQAALKCGLHIKDKTFRKQLGLPEASFQQTILNVQNGIILNAYSELLVPMPSEYPNWAFQTGYWRIPSKVLLSKEKIPPQVIQFCNSAPVAYITFGSMDCSYMITKSITKTLMEETDYHVILGTWNKQIRSEFSSFSHRIYFAAAMPYDQIFPKCDVIFHHGGSGTTAECIYAGVPAIIIPQMLWSDQRFWASMVQNNNLGVRVNAIDALKSTNVILNALAQAKDLKNGNDISKEISRESGAKVAASIVESYLKTCETCS